MNKKILRAIEKIKFFFRVGIVILSIIKISFQMFIVLGWLFLFNKERYYLEMHYIDKYL